MRRQAWLDLQRMPGIPGDITLDGAARLRVCSRHLQVAEKICGQTGI